MNEKIHNCQRRIDTMKKLIRQLHQGVVEDKIKKQLETMLEKADHLDIFQMDIHLSKKY
jgi:DUF438 domain-containing protein